MSQVVRTHVVLPAELVAEVDRLVGRRRRSQLFTQAVREKLSRMKLAAAARKAAGSAAEVDVSGWESHDAAAAWVRGLRRERDQQPDRGAQP